MFKLTSLLILLVSSINALTISNPANGQIVSNGATINVVVSLGKYESGVTSAALTFQSTTSSQSQTVQVSVGTPGSPISNVVILSSFLVGTTILVAIPDVNGSLGQVASPGFSSIVVGPPRPLPPYIPPYIPPYNPCYNPCYNPYRPICNIPRPRRESCNIPRPRCRIRESENSESVDFQMYYDSGLSLYLDQQAQAIEQFEREYEQHLIEQAEAETNVKVEA